ncbi:quinolinate synthetase [Advenella kashmirensis WT001]|uniref:Quinolinate synthetase n=1 Tax=Advenella kashmirensis (strain DSM 17095 / LMG 22695 / WT001) TaxID=1036672 RepID=I3U723_ADVKW|nr:quinolinate synthetase [Advenella kashmirensis WT001]
MNGLAGVANCLQTHSGQIILNPELGYRALQPIARMLDFAAAYKKNIRASGDLSRDVHLFSQIGPA